MTTLKRFAVLCVLALLIITQIGYGRGSAQEIDDATPAIEPTQAQTAQATETPAEEPTLAPTVTETPSIPAPTETPTETVDPASTPQPTTNATPAATAESTFSPAAAPSITISPSTFYPGQTITFTIKNVAGPRDVTVYWKTAQGWDDWTGFVIGSSGQITLSGYSPLNMLSLGVNHVGVQYTVPGGWAHSVLAETTVTVKAQPKATASLSSTRAIVNSVISYTVSNLSPNERLYITWYRPGGSTVAIEAYGVDNNGNGGATFRVPATTAGINKVKFYSTNYIGQTRSVTVSFEVVPRILITPASTTRGSIVNVSLRGYSKGESVRIRWKINGSWVVVATVTASNTGSANVSVKVPANAAIGANSVRGDGTTNRQQTNAVFVNG